MVFVDNVLLRPSTNCYLSKDLIIVDCCSLGLQRGRSPYNLKLKSIINHFFRGSLNQIGLLRLFTYTHC